MKNKYLFVPLLVTLLFISCSKNITEVVFDESFETEKSNVIESIPFEHTLFTKAANAGEGEEISISGKIRIAKQLIVDGKDFKLTYSIDPKGMNGLGLFTGNNYTITGGKQSIIAGTFRNNQFTDSFVEPLYLNGQGLADKIVIEPKFLIKVTSDRSVLIEAME